MLALRNIRIKNRLLLGFLFTVIIGGTNAVAGIYLIGQLNSGQERAKFILVSDRVVESLRHHYTAMASEHYKLLLPGNNVAHHDRQIEQSRQIATDMLKESSNIKTAVALAADPAPEIETDSIVGLAKDATKKRIINTLRIRRSHCFNFIVLILDF